MLALVVGCSKEKEAPAQASAQAQKPAAAESKKPGRLSLLPTCEGEGTRASPEWRSGPLLVGGGSQQKSFAASPGEAAVVVIQNGDGHGQGEVQSASVTLGGVALGTITSGTPLMVRRVTLAGQNVMDVSATGTGSVRVSVAAADTLPCVLADVSVTQTGSTPSTEVRTFPVPDTGALGVLVVDLYGQGANARVVYNGVNLLEGVPSEGKLAFAAVVALGATNTLEVTSQGNAGSVVRAAVFDADTLPPSLTLEFPKKGDDLTSSPTSASGTVGTDATEVTVSGVTATMSGGTFSASVPLLEGENDVIATARDFCGNVARLCNPVVLDTQAPLIDMVVNDTERHKGPVTLRWGLSDWHLVSQSATLNGVPVAYGTVVSAAGDYALEVSGTDRGGLISTREARFTVNPSAPVLTVTGVSDGLITSEPVTPVFGNAQPGVGSVTALLDGAPFTSGTQVTAEGGHVLVVTATNLQGHVARKVVRFAIDRTPPWVSVSGANDGAFYNSAVVLLFSSADDSMAEDPVVATLNDGRIFSGHIVTTEGVHSLQATAYDRAGIKSEDIRTFTLDFTPPVVSVSGVPVDQTVQQDVTPVFGATDANPQGVSATLNGEQFTTGTPVSTEGAYVLRVVATDKAGNKTTSVAHFTIDRTPPAIQVTGVEEGGKYRAAVVVGFSATDLRPFTLSAKLDGESFTTGTPVSAEGEHTLVVTATDGAQNIATQTVHFLVDTTPPTLTVESPTSGHATQDSEVSLVVVASDAHQIGDVKVGGAEMVLGADGKYRATLQLAEGSNAFEVVAYDRAGNSTPATLQVIKDTTPPELVVTSPGQGAFLSTSPVTLEGSVTDLTALTLKVGGTSVVPAEGGTFSIQRALQPGSNLFQIVATDAAGNTSTVTRTVRFNSVPPTLVVQDPPDGFMTTEAFVTVRGEVALGDATDTPAVTVDGAAVAVNAQGAFTTTVALPPGKKTLVVRVEDGYGLSDEESVTVTRVGGAGDGGTEPDGGTPPSSDGGASGGDAGVPGQDAGAPGQDAGTSEPAPPPVLVVEGPADGTVFGGMSFSVTGRVEDGELPLQVKVNGLPAGVSSRYFSTSMALLEGEHTLSIEVKDALGRTATAQRSITVDRTQPRLRITAPSSNPAQVTESPYLLQGTVEDVNLASLRVRGLPVVAIAGGFSVPVPLSAGDNAITVEAVDLAGNRRSVVQHLLISSVAPTVTITEPLPGSQAQAAIIPVRVEVTPATDLEEVRIGAGLATQVSEGVYTAQVSLSHGENTIKVTARNTQGITGSSSVTVRYRDASQDPLVVTGVDPEPGATGVETDALISVAFNKPVEAATAASHFEVWAQGRKLEGGYSVAPGAQTVTFVASRSLPTGESLQVKVNGMEAQTGLGMEAPFASEFTVRRPLTVVRGVVMDERLQPLSGVRVQVEGQELSARTGADGNWAILGVQGGSQVVLRYEGGTTSDGRTLPTVRRKFFVTAEEETEERALVLVAVEGASAQQVDGANGGEVTFGGVHGPMKLTVPAGGVIFADGATSGFLTATEVAPYLRPVPIEDRASATALWQLGPEQVRFLKPVELTLPNRTQLDAGRMVALLGFDESRLSMRRVGFGRVNQAKTAIVSDGPVTTTSLEFFGYMELSPAQQAAVEAALAQGGVPSGGDGGTSPGGDGGTSESEDGGTSEGELGLRLDAPVRQLPSILERLGSLVIGNAFAQTLGGVLAGYSAMDGFPGGIAHLKGVVRAAREDETQLTLKLPTSGELSQTREVDLPFAQLIEFKAQYHPNQPIPPTGDNAVTVIATLSAKGPNGSDLAPGADEQWLVQGANEATLVTEVDLPVGTTTLTLTGKTRFDTRAIRLRVQLEPIIPDSGTPTRAKLTLIKESDSSEGEEDPLHGAARFAGVTVNITSSNDSAAVSKETGRYDALVLVPAPDTMGIACAQIPIGPRFVPRLDEEGNTRFDSVRGAFSTCSQSFWMYPDQTTQADVVVDVRLLLGNVTFKHKDGTTVPVICKDVTQTERNPETGELLTISAQDVSTTEVHFFREDNLQQPIARYAVTRPLEETCADPANPPTGPQGMYSRVRLGPANSVARATRERCQRIAAEGPKTPEDESFYKAECGSGGSGFLRLSAGDRVVVFAVNHSTGYAGMKTVMVPPINRSSRTADGTCPDDAEGLLEIDEGGQKIRISHCTQQELGVPADVDLYPPEIDVRVQRRAQDEGLAQIARRHLIRTGGAGTTRDDYLQVVTHWRVRRAPYSMADGGVPASDGGTAGGGHGEVCDKGLRPDGGSCSPGAITDDDGQDGELLEVYCSELPPGATAQQWASCLRDDQQLGDVPRGVPPLAGQIIRVTGSAVEQPAVTTFPVAPGQNTVNVQASLRRLNGDGQRETINSLVSANYYLHVVGNRLLERDMDGDGYVSPSEDEAKPPHFEEPSSPPDEYPAGLPAQALYLKNVFKRYGADGALVEQYDLAREHEFRILKLEPQKVTARGDGSSRDMREQSEPGAKERDLSYEFLASLLAPEAGRAGTLSGDYRVRLGSDQFGIDCPLKIDEVTQSITATCGGEYIGEVLSASDILYLELYLSGNAENVLYRFNFYGLAARRDLLTASMEYTAEAAVKADRSDGKPEPGRPVSRPAMTNFFVEPAHLTRGLVKVCLNEACAGTQNLLKEATLRLQPDGRYEVEETQNGIVKEKLLQSKAATPTGARRFKLQLPAHLASMPGSGNTSVPVYLVLEPVEPHTERLVMALGRPEGSYNGANARAVGQEVVAGVNVTDGHLGFEHIDFEVPFLNGAFAFKRIYNNQNNQPTHLGLGWTHNFDGWVLEEKIGRYVVVIGGQGFAFPKCEKDPNPALEGNATCMQPGMTDKTHAFTLTVDAPLELPDGAQPDDKVILKTPDGWTFEFNRPVKGPREEGQRKWMLTRFGDSHARSDSNVGWTKLKYEGDTDRLSEVIQLADVGSMSLLFTYEDVDTEDEELPDYIRLLARNKDFKWMKALLMTSETGGNYSVTFRRDRTGNLRRAARWPGTPFQIYEYDYWPPALSMGPTEKWEALNELAVARTIHGDTLEANGPTHWRASYWRSSQSAPYRHIKAHEMVSGVSATGMQGERLEISYTASNERVVTRPDGVALTLRLNQSGNVGSKFSPLGAATTFWGSDSRDGNVVPTKQVAPTGREIQMSHGPSLVLKKVELTRAPENSRPVAGLGSGGTLVDYTLDDRFGLPSEARVKVGTGTATVNSPRSDTGDLTSISVSNEAGTRSLLQNAQYDADGLMQSYTDAQGRQVRFEDFNALGQPQKLIMALPEAATGGLESITRLMTYDPYGRLTHWEDVETQGFESTTFDMLNRPLTRIVSGTPQQSWTYAYEDQENALIITETLEKVSPGTTSQHQRTLYFEDGRLEGESFFVGDPAQQVSRAYEYEHGRLARVIDEEETPHVYHYDSEGRLRQVTANGLSEVEYTLDAEGKPTYVTDDLGRKTTIAYDGLGRPVFWDWGNGDKEEVQLDAQGSPVRRLLDGTLKHAVAMTAFDSLGNPQSTDSENSNGGVHEERRYDDAGRLTRLEDEELGLVETYEYKDVLGRPTKHSRTVATPEGELKLDETRTYDDQAHTLVVLRAIETGEDSRTETAKYTLDTMGRVLKVERTVDGQPAVDEYQYTERGQVWWHKSPSNAITQRFYDPLGHLVRVQDAENYTSTYELDAKGRVHVEHGPDPSYQCTYEYDELGRLVSKRVAAAGTTPETSWTYDYLPAAQEVKETVDLGGGRTIVTTRRSNARGRLVREVVSAASGSREMTADFQGPWEKSRTVSEGSGWQASTQYNARDDRGRALDEEEEWSAGGLSYNYTTTTVWSGRNATVSFVDDAGGRHDERTAYLKVDSLGNVVEVTRDGQTDRWLYDAAGVLAKETPAGTLATQYTYTEGLLEEESFGGETTVYTYYVDGRLKSRKTPDLREMQYDYWPRGMVKESRYGKSGDFQTTGFAYDANGALLSVTYGVGSQDAQQWQYTRGARGELLAVAQPGAGVFTYAYDGLLRLKKVTPPGNGTAEETFDYDHLGRPTLRTRGTTASWHTTWTSGLATQVDPNQGQTEVLLDGRGRVARVKYHPSTQSASNTDLTGVTYAYTAVDQPWKVMEERVSGPVENLFTYDARRLLTQTTRGSDSVGFTYTPSGQRLSMTSPVGALTYGYDELDRLKTITGPGSTDVTTLEWEPGGARLTGVKGGSLGERRCYNARGQVSAVLNAGVSLVSCDSLDTASGLHSRFDYTYDGRGNRLKEVYRDAQLPAAEETQYGYDAADRLTGVRYPNGVALLYQLTGDGTRKAEKEATAYGGTLGPDGFASAVAQRHWVFGLDDLGGLEGIYDANQTNQRLATYVTDAAGRLRSEVTPSGQKQYGWDAAGRLTRVTVQPAASEGSTTTATYVYGWNGLRVSRTVGGQTTGYLWAGEALVEERLPGQPAQLYTQAAGMTLSVGTVRIAHDGLGSAVGRVGATDMWHRYDVWGGYQTDKTHWTVPDAAQASLGYTGHSFDADAGLVYAQQRWYAPQLGRFLSQDSLSGDRSMPAGLHPWAYANGNPTRYVDSDGRLATLVTAVIGGAVGGAGGCALGAIEGGWAGCRQGAAIGGVTGFTAGLTAGASLAVGGSALLAGTTGGAVGAFAGTSLSSYYQGKTIAHSARMGLFSAPIGAAGGALGHFAGQVGGAYAARMGANSLVQEGVEQFVEGVSDDLIGQALGYKLGLQDSVDYLAPVGFGALASSVRGLMGARRGEHGFNDFASGKPYSSGFLHDPKDIMQAFRDAKHTNKSAKILKALEFGTLEMTFDPNFYLSGETRGKKGFVVNNSQRLSDVLAAIVHEGTHCMDMRCKIIPEKNPGAEVELLAEVRANRAMIEFVQFNDFKDAKYYTYESGWKELAIMIMDTPSYAIRDKEYGRRSLADLSPQEALGVVNKAESVDKKW